MMTTAQAREARAARNREAALQAFMAEKAKFEAHLADLQRMAEDHFGADPDAVLWDQVGSLAHWNTKLQQVTDSHFRRGEFA